MMTSVLSLHRKEIKMFWTLLLIATLSYVLVKLGALYVMVAVLSNLLYLAMLIIAGFVIILLWNRAFGKDRLERRKNDEQVLPGRRK